MQLIRSNSCSFKNNLTHYGLIKEMQPVFIFNAACLNYPVWLSLWLKEKYKTHLNFCPVGLAVPTEA